MQKHGAHGATDVTGFGILGHAQNLAKEQHAEVRKCKMHSDGKGIRVGILALRALFLVLSLS
jgi:hypothetical protein